MDNLKKENEKPVILPKCKFADSESSNIINYFYYDATGISTKKIYIPDTTALNKVIADWHIQGVKFVGFIHSHSEDKKFLSRLDIKYAQKIKSYCSMSEVLMVIYLPADNTFHQYCI